MLDYALGPDTQKVYALESDRLMVVSDTRWGEVRDFIATQGKYVLRLEGAGFDGLRLGGGADGEV